ncbi:MAG: PAS domain S-box protein [Pseudomonadota bacterium]|nr:PAS domain S-box protein [Pseudomonadota bacterium]
MGNDTQEQEFLSRETLVAREAMFRNAFEHASVGIAHVGPEGQWLNVNRRVAEIVGYAPDELLKITFQDITHPDDLDLDLGLLNEVLAGTRDTYRIEKRYFHKTGRIVWVTLSVSCIRTEAGEVDYFISVIQDITEKKRISRALADSEARFRAVQVTSPDGFMILRTLRSPTGEIEDFVWEFVNPAAEQVTGRTGRQLIGKRLLKEMPQVHARGLFEVFCGVVQSGEPWRREMLYPGHLGRRWFNFTVARVGDGFAISFQDVTARKEAELKLQASQARLRTILDGVMSMIGLARPDGVMLEVNKPSLSMTGANPAELVGLPIWDHPAWSHSAELQDRLRAAFAEAGQGRLVRFDAEIVDHADKLVPVDVQVAPIIEDSGEILEIVMSAIDISERKRAEAHREMLLSELNHRVKNSLATVQAIASHTQREASDLDSFRTSFTGRLRAIAASHDLLVSTRQDSADLSRLVADQLKGYAPAEPDRLTIAGPSTTLGPQGAHAFGLILHELATNASKYGAFSNASGRVRVSWVIAGEAAEPDIVIEWEETDGPPVAPPSRKGFGSLLIEQSLAHSLGGESRLEFDAEGLKARFRFPVKR